MKKIIKSKLLPVAIFAVIGIFLLVFLYYIGFRITYAPDLENSWNAVSAFAAWGGVFMSFLAIIAASIVAWRQNNISREQNEISMKQADIADKQNKIALFERRFEIVDLLICCKTSLSLLELASEDTDVVGLLFLAFSKPNQKFNYEEARYYLENCSTKLQHAYYFFSEQISPFIMIISADLFFLANTDPETDGPEKYHKKIQDYFEAVKNLDEYKIFAKIREEMTMI